VGRKRKTQKEVRFDTTEYTGGRGGAGEEKHKEKYDLILQSTLEGGGRVPGEENTQKEVRFDTRRYTGGRRGVGGEEKHYTPLLMSATKRFFTTGAPTGRRAPPSTAGHRGRLDREKMGISKLPCCRHTTGHRRPGPSMVLPLRWGIIELPGPAGMGSGVDCMVFYSEEGPAPRRAAARVWAILAVKNHTKVDPGTPSGRPRKLYYPPFSGKHY